MADMVSEMLSIGGRLMTCIEELEEDGMIGERRYYGMRDGMGMRDGGRYGMRHHDREEYDPYDMDERRRYRRY